MNYFDKEPSLVRFHDHADCVTDDGLLRVDLRLFIPPPNRIAEMVGRVYVFLIDERLGLRYMPTKWVTP